MQTIAFEPDKNAFLINPALREAVDREADAGARDRCTALGELVGSAEARWHVRASEEQPPILHAIDRPGGGHGFVERSESWHWLINRTLEHDLHGLPWRAEAKAGHATRASLVLLWGELSLPSICPASGNYSMVPALAETPELATQYVPRLLSRDGAPLFAAASLTEKQGGSDVRACATRAEPLGDGLYALTGSKWFVTCPWSDLILVLARAEGGLTCFLVESDQPGFRIEKLKQKLGWHPLGVGEIELIDVIGRRLGEEGRGIGTIMRMIAYTRLDVLLECVSSLRNGTVRAIRHCRERRVLGRTLVEHDAMRNVLADLSIESEAATAASMRLARSLDTPDSRFDRIAAPVLKYHTAKRAAGHAAEALECLGGNGYVEDSDMPRHLRDAVLGSVWEGSGNVAALDVLRAIRSDPASLEEFLAECALARGESRALNQWLDALSDRVRITADGADAGAEWGIRELAGSMAVALQASLLLRHAPSAVASAFCASRLPWTGGVYGHLPLGTDVDAILERALPA